MPGYAEVKILTKLGAVKTTVDQVKGRSEYDGNEVRYDQMVVDVLTDDQKTAEGFIDDNALLVKGKATKCKERTVVIQNIASKNTVTDADLKLARLSAETAQKYTKEIHDDNRELNDALKNEYRGGWPDKARGILHDKSKVNPFMAVRQKGINTGKQVPALTARCDQYVKRAKEFLKQILQTSKQGAVEMDQFNKDCANILAKMTKKKTQIAGLRQKVDTSIDFYLKTLKKKKEKDYVAGDLASGQARISDINSRAKDARGIFKTMTVQYDGLKKRAKAAGPGWKDKALQAVKDAKSEYTAAEKAMKEFNDEEKECVKLLAKVKKKVG